MNFITNTKEYMEDGDRRFIDQPNLTPELPRYWTVVKRIRYQTDLLKSSYPGERGVQGKIIVVPRGFVTDFASIPRGLRSIVTKDGPNRWAAILHDYLYSLGGKGPKGLPRKVCDDMFMEAMIDLGVPMWKRKLMYRGVRAGGWYRWDERGKQTDEE
jgi:hypothetical protein